MNDPLSNAAAISQLPKGLEPFLILLYQPLKLPVCRICRTALLPRSIVDHLRKHHFLSPSLRKTVRALAEALPSLDFTDVPNGLDGQAPMEVLRIVNAFQCKHCSFIRRDVTDLRKHLNMQHGIGAKGEYGEVKAQSWFGGRRAVYWRVCVESTNEKEAEWEGKGKMLGLKKEELDFSTLNMAGFCQWGFYGMGWGHRQPVSRREERSLAEGTEMKKIDVNIFKGFR